MGRYPITDFMVLGQGTVNWKLTPKLQSGGFPLIFPRTFNKLWCNATLGAHLRSKLFRLKVKVNCKVKRSLSLSQFKRKCARPEQ